MALSIDVTFNCDDKLITEVTGNEAGWSVKLNEITGFSQPKDGAYCTPNNTLYITSNGSNNVKVINCATNTVIATINVGGISQGIIYNPTTTNYPKGVIYVGVGNTVKAIDCDDNSIIETYALTNSPVNMEFDTEYQRLYIVKLSTSVVDILDATGLLLAPSSTITAGNTPSGIAYYASVPLFSYKMYITNYGAIANSVTVVDCASETISTTITGITRGYGCVVDQPNDELYVMQATIDMVQRIDCVNDVAIGSPISVGVSPSNGVYNEEEQKIYVTNIGDDTISIIDCNTKAVIKTATVGDDPFGVDYCSVNKTVYLTNNTDNTVQEVFLRYSEDGKPFTYQWYLLVGMSYFPIASATNPTLQVNTLGFTYKCIVTDQLGETAEDTVTTSACPIPTPDTTPYSNCCDNQTNIFWLNRTGGFENYIFTGVKTFEVDGGDSKSFITDKVLKYSEKTKIYNGKIVTTSSVPKSHVDKLDSLRQSIQAWEYDETTLTFTEIILDTTSYEKYTTKKKIFDVAIRYLYAEEITIQRQ